MSRKGSRSRPASKLPSRTSSPAPALASSSAQQSTPPPSNVKPNRPDLVCAPYAHTYDATELKDRFFPEFDLDPKWTPCPVQPCPNRYNRQNYPVNAGWAALPVPSQEASIRGRTNTPPPPEQERGRSTTPSPLSPLPADLQGSSAEPPRPPSPPPPPTPPPTNMSTNANPTNSERGQKPEDFMGERAKSRRFLALFRNYLRLNKTRYPSEEDKVSLFLSFFKGDVGGQWAETRLTEYDNDQDDERVIDANKRWTTLTSIIEKFKSDFKPTAHDVAARTAIETIRQEGKLMDLDEYNTFFETYADDSGFDQEALLYFYKKGLHPKLADRVSNTYPLPKGLAEYKVRAMELQQEYLARRAEKARWNPPRTARPSGNAPPTGRAATASINALVSTEPGARPFSAPLSKLTPDERQQLIKDKACFRCRQPGHISNQCPLFNRGAPRSFPSSSVAPGRAIRAVDTPSSSNETALAADPRDAIKDISDLVARVRSLQGEEKEQAAAYLKDITSSLDF